MTLRLLGLGSALFVTLAGCAAPPSDDGAATASALASAISHTEDGDVTTSRVDARNREAWIYLDLGWKTEVFPTSPATSAAWDLAFQQAKVRSNGGTSGSGGVEVAALPGASFDTVSTAPTSGYAADGEALAFASWFTYDMTTHVLSPADVVFVVKSVGGDYYKVKFTQFYEGGVGGYPTFRWAPIAPPAK